MKIQCRYRLKVPPVCFDVEHSFNSIFICKALLTIDVVKNIIKPEAMRKISLRRKL